MTVSIIGGSGFIGTRLCKRLKDSGQDFVIIDKNVSQSFPDATVKTDVRDIDSLRKTINGDVIINLAAEHRDDVRPKSLYDEVNVQGTRNVCQVAREKGIQKIIFTSSVAVFGFAPPNTDENGRFAPFNDYGRTKLEAEYIYREWQAEDPLNRSLIIIRPTVTFGEQNRGNVYNLLNQIAKGRFIMVGSGENHKSMAYVENVAAFIEHSLSFGSGLHVYNYIDKPDFTMNELVIAVYRAIGKGDGIGIRIPYSIGLIAGKAFDIIANVTGRSFPVSSIRMQKFCSTTQFETSIKKTGFIPPVPLHEALHRTIRYEFLEDHSKEYVFYTE